MLACQIAKEHIQAQDAAPLELEAQAPNGNPATEPISTAPARRLGASSSGWQIESARATPRPPAKPARHIPKYGELLLTVRIAMEYAASHVAQFSNAAGTAFQDVPNNNAPDNKAKGSGVRTSVASKGQPFNSGAPHAPKLAENTPQTAYNAATCRIRFILPTGGIGLSIPGTGQCRRLVKTLQ
jgi:hypothetical protein